VSEPRDIHVTLTFPEFVALRTCVSGELESLTEADWKQQRADDLDRADQALQRAINRRNRKKAAA
jgi:hypothetical protein